MVKTTALALAAAALVAAPPRARADTLVFPVEGADTTASAPLTRALLAGADSDKPRLADTPLGEAASLLECNASDRACLDSMAQAMEADSLLAASIRRSGPALAAHVTFYRRGQEPVTRDVDLPADPEAAAPILEREVRALIRGDSAAQPAAPAAPVAAPAGRGEEAALGASAPDDDRRFSFGRVRPWAWAIAGGGLVLVGVGAAFAVKAGGLEDDVESAPRNTVSDLERLEDLEHQGQTATTMSNVLLITGSVAALAGVGLVLWQGLTPSPEERGRALTLSPAPLRGGAGLVLSGALP